MKKVLMVAAIVLVALGAGVGGAYAVYKLTPLSNGQTVEEQNLEQSEILPQVQEGKQNREDLNQYPFGNQAPGMMPGRQGGRVIQAERITVEKAMANVNAYAAAAGKNLQAVEIMEFSRNFYAVIKETDTGKAAFEVLVDPFTGKVSPEIGPNMMWNLKYGHMMQTTSPSAANKLTMQEAVTLAQKALDVHASGAVVQSDGNDFYGYYSFDFTVDGKVAGMLSVNGEDGNVWFHTWHGSFISEQEMK